MENNTELLNEEQQIQKKEWITPNMEVLIIESGAAFGSEASPGFPS